MCWGSTSLISASPPTERSSNPKAAMAKLDPKDGLEGKIHETFKIFNPKAFG